MQTITKVERASWLQFVNYKLQDYSMLVKTRLNLTVVFSAIIGALLAFKLDFAYLQLFFLGVGGFLVTGSANAINQIIEKNHDRRMKRTANRPLATGRMSETEAVLIAGISGVIGLLILGYCFNALAALIGAISLFSYAFIYTPLKRVGPVAVFVGAIPGALPPVIGWVAATGTLGFEAYVLFGIQFLWQFPHFWAIGWLGDKDYRKAGFKMSPKLGGQSKYMAFQIVVYTAFLIVVSLMPVVFGMVSIYFVPAALILGAMLLYTGIQLFLQCNNKAALKVMLASVIYLPLLQIALVVSRVCM